MFVYKYPRWVAQIHIDNKTHLSFDGVKDMMKYYFEPKRFHHDKKEFKDIMPKKANKSKKIKYLSDNEVSRLLEFLEKGLKNKKHYSYIHSLGIS